MICVRAHRLRPTDSMIGSGLRATATRTTTTTCTRRAARG
jgi:hypothetical protein